MVSRSTIRSFHYPQLWLAMWLLMIAGVVVLSLMPGPPIPDLLAIAKFDHFLAYLLLQLVAVQLTWSRPAQLQIALAMVALGILLELAQGYLTTYRDMSAYDAGVDAVGVAVGFASGWSPWSDLLLRVERRFSR